MKFVPKKQRKLAEKEAWRILAGLFTWLAAGGPGPTTGLCNELSRMYWRGEISEAVLDRMQRRIDAYDMPVEAVYLAPAGFEGAQVRVKFCLQMARALK